MNNFWVRDVNLSRAGRRFFGVGSRPEGEEPDWTELRDQWEGSHMIRAALGLAGLLLLAISLVI